MLPLHQYRIIRGLMHIPLVIIVFHYFTSMHLIIVGGDYETLMEPAEGIEPPTY